MRITVNAYVLLLFSLSALGQESQTFLKNWNSNPVPEDIMVYRNAKNNWIVYLDKNEIRAFDDYAYRFKFNSSKKILPFNIEASGLIDVIQIEDGYIVGFNRGEWGGGLYWYSKKGKRNKELFGSLFSPPIQFLKRGDEIYAITGLSHLGLSYGSIIKIEKEEKKWCVKEFIKLPDAPCAIQVDSKDNLLVFTSSGLYSIDKQAKIDTIAIKNRRPIIPTIIIELPNDTLVIKQKPINVNPEWVWGFLNPSSMVIQNDVVYVGMRGGIYKFDLTTKKEEWLMPH